MPETLHDPALVLVSIGAVGTLAFLTRRLVPSPPFRRRTLHAAVGVGTLVVTPLFHGLTWAVIPPLLFGLLNTSGRARERLGLPSASAREARGYWTFPAAVALTYLVFWEPSPRPGILAGLAALALGDPVAGIVGTRWGQRRWRLGGGRTLEGSIAFLGATALAVGFIAWGAASDVPGPAPRDAWIYSIRMGIGCGVVGAVAEAWTPSSWDNLTIPLAVAAAYRFLA